jgi:hypothetical protein
MIAAEIFEKTVLAKWIICDKSSSRDKIADVMAVSISSSASGGYSCKNPRFPVVSSFYA